MKRNRKGSLVLTHSTFGPGVKRVLERIAGHPDIDTLTPGKLRNTKKASVLRIRVTVPIVGGHKIVIRSQGVAQEGFIHTALDATKLQEIIDEVIA